MERESFEDEEIGKILSDNFVCIKVDREERPDVDKVYMTFVQVWFTQKIICPDTDILKKCACVTMKCYIQYEMNKGLNFKCNVVKSLNLCNLSYFSEPELHLTRKILKKSLMRSYIPQHC